MPTSAREPSTPTSAVIRVSSISSHAASSSTSRDRIASSPCAAASTATGPVGPAAAGVGRRPHRGVREWPTDALLAPSSGSSPPSSERRRRLGSSGPGRQQPRSGTTAPATTASDHEAEREDQRRQRDTDEDIDQRQGIHEADPDRAGAPRLTAQRPGRATAIRRRRQPWIDVDGTGATSAHRRLPRTHAVAARSPW